MRKYAGLVNVHLEHEQRWVCPRAIWHKKGGDGEDQQKEN